MLMLIEDNSEKLRIQKTLEGILLDALPDKGRYTLGYKGENYERILRSHPDSPLYYVPGRHDEAHVPRYANTLGILDRAKATQDIVVEINIPIKSNGQQAAGFFAKESRSGRIYLMHTGRVGGGRAGIGKLAYLAWSDRKPVPVIDNDGGERFGIVVAEIDEKRLVADITKFVEDVKKFKRHATGTKEEIEALKKKIGRFQALHGDEFSGTKRGRTQGVFEYDTYHGDIVKALRQMLEADLRSDEEVFRTGLIDLLVERKGKRSQVYEVKTGMTRQHLYTAIGQLIVHSGDNKNCRKFLVIPSGEDLPDDVNGAVGRAGIEIMRFRKIRKDWRIEPA